MKGLFGIFCRFPTRHGRLSPLSDDQRIHDGVSLCARSLGKNVVIASEAKQSTA
jgi:hypothetical protein